MKLSVVIPARDEVESIAATVMGVTTTLDRAGLEHEVLVVDDHSTDGTGELVEALAAEAGSLRCVRSPHRPGYGFAVRTGLETFEGDAVAILMADGSDDPADLVRYYHLLEEGYDCAFGSRFVSGSRVTGYPRLKLVINRAANLFIRLLFRHGYNDTTNAFKAYRREVIDGIQPLFSNHFNLTVEMPLKAVVRGFSYGIVPVSWTNREHGVSKLGIQEMGSRYLFIVLYAWLEDHLSRGDYTRRDRGSRESQQSRARRRATR
jgi:dolichol-phosphate mannosyltransferase